MNNFHTILQNSIQNYHFLQNFAIPTTIPIPQTIPNFAFQKVEYNNTNLLSHCSHGNHTKSTQLNIMKNFEKQRQNKHSRKKFDRSINLNDRAGTYHNKNRQTNIRKKISNNFDWENYYKTL